ncbi:unnamed protein product [Adineta steineri]|uniref:Uncharacterized protein n=1 Tax=Adineta steineri TaxID=433720 RepID=A0A815FZB6_9BILA|nr:unnamed protein product [Adineta steineri]CAF4017485.1 unnamed protein product [Adineta steineri]
MDPLPPWGLLYAANSWKMDSVGLESIRRFGVIEIQCNDKEEFRELMRTYRGRQIRQADIMEYLEIIGSRFCQVSKMTVTVIPTEHPLYSLFGGSTEFKWRACKMQVIIDRK